MLKNLRYQIALYFVKKASEQIERGEIRKGLINQAFYLDRSAI